MSEKFKPIETETRIAEEKFLERIKQPIEVAVSGKLKFGPEKSGMILQNQSDLDGRISIGLLERAGIKISKINYLKPGEYQKGAVNLDTGDKAGFEYDSKTNTFFFDHHSKELKEKTSSAEVVYKALQSMGLLKRSKVLDRIVDFVTKIDNRLYPPEDFLKSAKTLIGLQRELKLETLLAYFKEHQDPNDELSPEEWEKYGLKEAAEKQQKLVDESMETLNRMEMEGKIIDTAYGKVVINVNNELPGGSSAAYTKYDGIISIIPGKSFAVTFKEKEINENALREKLGDKFQGKVIRGKMWIYNEKEPLKLSLAEIIEAIKWMKWKNKNFQHNQVRRNFLRGKNQTINTRTDEHSKMKEKKIKTRKNLQKLSEKWYERNKICPLYYYIKDLNQTERIYLLDYLVKKYLKDYDLLIQPLEFTLEQLERFKKYDPKMYNWYKEHFEIKEGEQLWKKGFYHQK